MDLNVRPILGDPVMVASIGHQAPSIDELFRVAIHVDHFKYCPAHSNNGAGQSACVCGFDRILPTLLRIFRDYDSAHPTRP